MDKKAKLPQAISSELSQKFTVQDNALARDVKANPKDRITLEIGDTKQPDQFHPQAKILRWDNEVNASFRYVDPEPGEATIKTEGNVVKYVKPKVEFHAYDLDPAEGLEDGGLEIELLLKEKPDTNRFDFTIQTKGLDFYYQPALTPEEIDEGASRPDDVIGSYAVYHATKGGMNDVAGMEYKVGKAFHIYRPFAHDANGDGIWCDLNVDTETGILNVTIDSTWLEKAIYPVLVDPTFGYTSIGGSTTSVANRYRGAPGTPAEGGDVTTITAYIASSVSSNDKCALYVGSDRSLVSPQSEERNPAGGGAWEDFTVSDAAVTNQSYYVTIWTSGETAIAVDSGASENLNTGLTYTTTWPNPAGATLSINKPSIYATYTADEGGEAPVDGPSFQYRGFWGPRFSG